VPARIHLLRRESITPIARYLERARHNTDLFEAQLDLAVALLYREREYRAMHQAHWFSGKTPSAVHSSDANRQPPGGSKENQGIFCRNRCVAGKRRRPAFGGA
jgi:hypothetical protein